MNKLKLAPSILAADFANLARDIDLVKKAHYLHLDVMDGHFVPNISFGIPIVESIRPLTEQILDVHLMITHPGKYIDAFASAGADIITFHAEVEEDLHANIDRIKSLGLNCGLSVKPQTNIEVLYPYLDKIDMVLIMSVEPGFGGQKFMPQALNKAKSLKKYMNEKELNIDIQMDGGIYLTNVQQVIEAGVNIIVAGNSIFKAEDAKQRVMEFYEYFNEG